MVRIIIPRNNLPERHYIIEVLLDEFLGIDFEIQTDSNSSNYEIVVENGNRVIIEDHFFSKFKADQDYLNIGNLPEKIESARHPFLPEKDLPVIYGTTGINIREESSGQKSIICGIDLFASSFFMLTRWEEYVSNKRDKLQRFSAEYSIAFKNSFLNRPVVNEYCELLWNLLNHAGCKAIRKERHFTPYITHDVDFIRRWNGVSSLLRALSGDLLKRRNLKLFFHNLKDFLYTKLKLKNDPYNTFDFLMTQSERRGYKSHFFFISAHEPARQGIYYKLSDPVAIQLMKDIQTRGHSIGFHPDLNSFKDGERWKKELEQLKSFSPQEIVIGRQHYLQFEVPVTWQIWNDMGMVWDSTLSYDDKPGFRTGSCYTYSVYNFLTRKKLQLKEKPLIIMDKSLVMHHRGLSITQLEDMAKEIIDRVRKYRGDFVLLWHNSCLNIPEWENYKSIYLTILDHLKQKTAP